MYLSLSIYIYIYVYIYIYIYTHTYKYFGHYCTLRQGASEVPGLGVPRCGLSCFGSSSAAGAVGGVCSGWGVVHYNVNHYTLFPLHPPLMKLDAYITGLAKGPLRKGFVGLWILPNTVEDNYCKSEFQTMTPRTSNPCGPPKLHSIILHSPLDHCIYIMVTAHMNNVLL